jgi:hypothetical protein
VPNALGTQGVLDSSSSSSSRCHDKAVSMVYDVVLAVSTVTSKGYKQEQQLAVRYALLSAELLLYVNSVSLYLQLPMHRNSSPNALVRCNSTGSQWWLSMSHRWCLLPCGMRWATPATTLHLCSLQLVASFSSLRANLRQSVADNDRLELQ